MTRDADNQLQEFLDGRLSAAEREAFEARLKDDAELARRVDEYREMRQALREDGPPLSDGFYTRARARFEESSPAPRSAWTRLVSWEAAGLAAAALLTAAVFFPDLFDRRLPEPGVAPRKNIDEPSLPDPTAGPETTGRQDSGTIPPSDERVEALQQPREPVPEVREKKESRRRAASSLGEREASVPEEAPVAEGTPVPEEAPGPEVQAFAEPPRSRASAAAPPIAGQEAGVAARRSVAEPMAEKAPAQEPVTGAAADLVEQDPALLDKTLRAEGRSQFARSDEYAPDVRLLQGIVLPAGAMEPGRLGTIDTEEQWNAWVRGPGGAEFASAEYDSDQRLLLIGPRDRAFDCSRIQVRVSGGAYRLILEPSSSSDAVAAAGCAVFLPRDGRQVELEERP